MCGRLIPMLVACAASLTGNVGAVRATEEAGAAANSALSARREVPRSAAVPGPAPAGSRARLAGENRGSPAVGAQTPSALPPESPTPRRRQEQVIRSAVPTPAVSPPELSLGALENLALRNNPTIPAAEALVLQQQGLLIQVTRYPNPTVGWVQSTPSQLSQGATQGAFISQDIVTAGKLSLAGQAEKAEIEWRSWQLKAQIGRVVNDVRIRYFEVLGAQHAMIAAREIERLASVDLRAVEQLLEAKQASRPDLLQAEIHLNAVRSSLENARLRHQAAWRQLANVVGVPQLPPSALPDSLEGDISQLDWQQSLHRLLAESPVLRAQAAQVQAAAYELQLQKRLVIPNITTQVVIQRDYIKDFNQVSTLVAAPIPLFNRNRGNIINAEGLLRQQRHEYQRTQLALADQLATSFQQYLGARNQVDHLREILPRTQENLKLTTQAFREGQTGFNFMRVLDAEQTYYQTKTSYINALTSLRKLAIEISGLELTGGLNPTEVGTALQAAAGLETGVRNVLLQQAQQQNAGALSNLPGAIQSTISGP